MEVICDKFRSVKHLLTRGKKPKEVLQLISDDVENEVPVEEQDIQSPNHIRRSTEPPYSRESSGEGVPKSPQRPTGPELKQRASEGHIRRLKDELPIIVEKQPKPPLKPIPPDRARDENENGMF